jgi:hypothetical protein
MAIVDVLWCKHVESVLLHVENDRVSDHVMFFEENDFEQIHRVSLTLNNTI